MTEHTETESLQDEIVATLKTIYDPEIPVNIYDLGLIYKIDIEKLPEVFIEMTLTSPNCPMTDVIMYQIENRVKLIAGIETVLINLVFEPAWDKEMISEEGKLKLGFL